MVKKTVLIVDDDLAQGTSLATLFRLHRFRTLNAGSAAEALTIIQDIRPDVILSDYRMPGKEGLHLHHLVRMMYRPDTIPFILINVAADRRKLEKVDVDAIFPKRTSFTRLLAAVLRLV